jgi:hypothetical protein
VPTGPLNQPDGPASRTNHVCRPEDVEPEPAAAKPGVRIAIVRKSFSRELDYACSRQSLRVVDVLQYKRVVAQCITPRSALTCLDAKLDCIPTKPSKQMGGL